MTELLKNLALEALYRALLKNLGLDRAAFTEVKLEPMKSNEPDRMTIKVTLGNRDDVARPEVVGQVTVTAIEEPYGTATCIIGYRPARQPSWQWPNISEYDWLHTEDVAAAA